MNRIHTITVPYAVMKACPMSWVQRVHIHKGLASVNYLMCNKTDKKCGFLENLEDVTQVTLSENM